jgi:integration host factor subunit beta
MIKADLVRKIGETAELNLKESEVVVDRLFAAITEILGQGQKLELRGFGTFGVRRVKAKVGRNLSTGESVPISPYNKPYFKPGVELKPWSAKEPPVSGNPA